MQANNKAGGDLAGRDVNKNVTNITVSNSVSLYLKKLYEKILLEASENSSLKEYSEDLDYYSSRLEGDVIGLEQKLKDGNRVHSTLYAKELKERFHKKLIRTTQFSEGAQGIFVFLLASVRMHYMMNVYPAICRNEDEATVNVLIQEYIIKSLIVELGDNLLCFNHEDVLGMLYFLTGNCHIKWTE